MITMIGLLFGTVLAAALGIVYRHNSATGNPREFFSTAEQVAYAIIGAFCGLMLDIGVSGYALPDLITTPFVNGHFVFSGWRYFYHLLEPVSEFAFTILGIILGWYLGKRFPNAAQMPPRELNSGNEHSTNKEPPGKI